MNERFKRLHARTSDKKNLNLLSNDEYKKYSRLMKRVDNLVDKLNKLDDQIEALKDVYKYKMARSLENDFYEADAKIDALIEQINELTDFAFDRNQNKKAS